MGHPIAQAAQAAQAPTLLTSALNILSVAPRGDPPTSTSPGQFLRRYTLPAGFLPLSVLALASRSHLTCPFPKPHLGPARCSRGPGCTCLRVHLFRSVTPGRTGMGPPDTGECALHN